MYKHLCTLFCVQGHLCPGTFVYRVFCVQIHLCTGSLVYRYIYVQGQLCTRTLGYKTLCVQGSYVQGHLCLYEKCNILSVKERLQYFTLYVAYNSIRAPYFCDNLTKFESRYELSLREGSHLIQVPKTYSKISNHSCFYQSVKLWNALPRTLRENNFMLVTKSEFEEKITKICMTHRFSHNVLTN